MFRRLKGKSVKVVYAESPYVEPRPVYGTLVDANESFICMKDRFGRTHFVATETIKRMSEWNAGKSERELNNNGLQNT